MRKEISGKRSWLTRVLRFAMAFVLLFVASEVILRLFGYGSFIVYRPDQELLWTPRPNQKGKTVVGGRAITINGSGFRYKSDLGRRKPDEVRIFTFGDSVTMGWGVDDDSHYSAVLEQLLAERSTGRRFRVVSAGVNAYPTSLCVRRFVRLLNQGEQIDIAILAYSFNQAFDNLTKLEGEERQQFLNKVRLKGIVRRFALYNFLIEDLLRTAVYYRLRGRLMPGSWEVGRQDDRDDEDDYVNSLRLMKSASERHGVAFVLLLLGSKGQQGNQLDRYQQAFLAFGEEGIPVVNMIERLAPLDPEETFMDHTHPSLTGHELVARELLPVAERLTPPP